MSTKFFCDICDREMSGQDLKQLEGAYGKVSVRVMAGTNKPGGIEWNSGHFCHSCLESAVHAVCVESRAREGEGTRPQPAGDDTMSGPLTRELLEKLAVRCWAVKPIFFDWGK